MNNSKVTVDFSKTFDLLDQMIKNSDLANQAITDSQGKQDPLKYIDETLGLNMADQLIDIIPPLMSKEEATRAAKDDTINKVATDTMNIGNQIIKKIAGKL